MKAHNGNYDLAMPTALTVAELVAILGTVVDKSLPVFIFDQVHEEIFALTADDVDLCISDRVDLNCQNVRTTDQYYRRKHSMTTRELRQTVRTLKYIIDAFDEDLQYAAEVSTDVEQFDVAELDRIGSRIQELHEAVL